MNSQEQMNAIRQVLTMLFSMMSILVPTLATQAQYSMLTTAICTAVPALCTIGSIVWSMWAHWGMKKVPDNATAVILPGGPEPKGAVLDLTPMAGLAKVVGVILLCLITVPALAQTKNSHFPLPIDPLNLNPKIDAAATKAGNDLASYLTQLADFSDAATLATSIPGLQDNVGAACWQQFAPIQTLLKAHPLPLTLHIAVDIEALRLLAYGLNQVCGNPNCSSMWNDAGNAANAIAGTPIPISLTSICAKVPVITTAAAAAGIVAAPIGTVTPAAAPAK